MPFRISHRSLLVAILLGTLVAVGTVARAQPPGGEPSSFDLSVPETVPDTAPNMAADDSDAPQPATARSTEANTADAKRVHRSLDQMVRGLDHTGTPRLPQRGGELPAPSAEAGVERPLPEYDGRPKEPANAADVLIWVPRILLYPAHLVMQWGVRWPIVTLITLSEKYAIAERINDLLTWDEGRAGFFPRFLLDFGVQPHGGLSFFWNELGGSTDIAASVSAGYGDSGELIAARVSSNTRVFRNDSAIFSMHGSYVRRPDNPFYGTNDQPVMCNPAASEVDDSRGACHYRSEIGEVDIGLVAVLDELNRVSATLTFRDAKFSNEDRRTTYPRMPEDSVDRLVLPGFNSGYRLLEAEVIAELDSRSADVEFQHGSGVRLELMGSFAFDPTHANTRFFRYGGEASAFWDFGNRHVVAGRLYMEFIANVSERDIPDGPGGYPLREPIPFTELITLGGLERMRGFLQGRLRGHRAWVATLEYRWPIHGFFDATAFASIGNVFPSFVRRPPRSPAHPEPRRERALDFDIRSNYLNYGIGFRTNGSREVVFEILVALGTNRLDSPSVDPIQSGRLVIGINHGF